MEILMRVGSGSPVRLYVDLPEPYKAEKVISPEEALKPQQTKTNFINPKKKMFPLLLQLFERTKKKGDGHQGWARGG